MTRTWDEVAAELAAKAREVMRLRPGEAGQGKLMIELLGLCDAVDARRDAEAKKLDFKCPGCRKVKPRRFATGTGWCSACVAVDAHLRSER